MNGEIIASMTSGLLVVDGEEQVRTVNPAALKMLGMPAGPWNGPLREVLAGAAPLAAVVEECLRSGSAVVRRTVSLPGPGLASHLGVTVSPIRDSGEGTQGAICLFTDLTAVMELEEQLRLKDSLARLGELTAGIAHEFRNGLATIHGYGRLLVLDKLPDEYRPYVVGIRGETEALGQIVTNFLNFAKPTDLVLTPVDMHTIAQRAADDIRADAAARGGQVTVTGAFGDVEGDEVLLRQAFSNLCRNALEACVDAKVVPHVTVDGVIDRTQHTFADYRDRQRPRCEPGRCSHHVPAVLHDEGARHRARARAGAEDHRHPQWPRLGVERRGRRRPPGRHPAPLAALSAAAAGPYPYRTRFDRAHRRRPPDPAAGRCGAVRGECLRIRPSHATAQPSDALRTTREHQGRTICLRSGTRAWSVLRTQRRHLSRPGDFPGNSSLPSSGPPVAPG